MSTLPLNTEEPQRPRIKIGRIVGGVALILGGACLLPILPLTAIGACVMFFGIVVITAAVIRGSRGPDEE